MRYIASLPLMAPYLEQYVRYHSGGIDKETIDLKNFQDAIVLVKRNLVPFTDEESAKKRWPGQFDCDVKAGADELLHYKPKVDAFYVLGPKGASEVVSILLAYFDMAMIQEWTINCAEYAKTMTMPSKRSFILAFMERHGILPGDCEYQSVMKRFQRITDKTSAALVQND